MRLTVLNFAVPEPVESLPGSARWWHKSGSRWPASIIDRANDGSDYFPWPFLLSYLASLLEADGSDVTVLDGCLEKWSLELATQATRESRPDYLVFETSEQTEYSDPDVLAAIESVAPVVLIGPNVTPDRTDLLSWPGVQALVPGEYLLSVRDFFRDPHPGIAASREVLGEQEMDALPFARREAVTFPRYNARFKTTPPGLQGQFVSMWGCQYRCKFCIWIHSYWPRSNQFRKQFSIPRLEAELEHLRRAFPQTTSFYDDSDNHEFRGEKASEFAAMMGRQGLPWALLTRADTYLTSSGDVDREMWRNYRDNGCYAVKIGVEGGQAVMDATNKHLSEETVREFVPIIQDLGMSVYCSFMLDVPGAPPGSDATTLRLVEDLAAYRPELFEYFISACDVTQTTPFAAFTEPRLRHDGQRNVEAIAADSPGIDLLKMAPNNLRRP